MSQKSQAAPNEQCLKDNFGLFVRLHTNTDTHTQRIKIMCSINNFNMPGNKYKNDSGAK